MAPDTGSIAIALGLMRKALTLLEARGVADGAAHLRRAIEATRTGQPLSSEDEISPDLACLVAAIPLNDPLPSAPQPMSWSLRLDYHRSR